MWVGVFLSYLNVWAIVPFIVLGIMIIIITRFTTQHNNIKGTSIEHDPSLIMMMM